MRGCERPHVKSKSWTGAVVESAASHLSVDAINEYKSTQTEQKMKKENRKNRTK